ncbi:hypothetical protein N3873_004175 [Escherichia coli]|uniref:hypothetical protein n=1 Tax=Escherichia coli TaxID=562 RepID=UPI000BE7E113|nr:hypothetical protein [Escherichia coli]EJT9437657.1 hypothetical protein [Escherichia coli]TXR31467.1 hypothetical protein FV313_11905 [Escherichia coli]HDH7514517.1 hypothetical protein [Escherichia coli]
MGKGSIRAGKLARKDSRIVAGENHQVVSTINFSFRYIDAGHEKFSFAAQDSAYFCKVLERLKDLSTLTEREFIADRGATLKSHSIDWRETSEPEGFTHLNEQFQSYTPYQFAVSRNEHGRVHGFFIGNVFHIVWLDPHHRLYPGR